MTKYTQSKKQAKVVEQTTPPRSDKEIDAITGPKYAELGFKNLQMEVLKAETQAMYQELYRLNQERNAYVASQPKAES